MQGLPRDPPADFFVHERKKVWYNAGMIAFISNLLKSLNANTNPGEIAHGFACGMVLGFLPKDNLLWPLAFVFLLFVRINKPAYLVMLAAASALTPALDPTFDRAGMAFLTREEVRGAYTFLLDVPFVAFTKINNSVVIGSLLAGLAAYAPTYALGRVAVWAWRKHAVMLLRRSRLIKVISGIPVVSKIAKLVGDRI